MMGRSRAVDVHFRSDCDTWCRFELTAGGAHMKTEHVSSAVSTLTAACVVKDVMRLQLTSVTIFSVMEMICCQDLMVKELSSFEQLEPVQVSACSTRFSSWNLHRAGLL
ncbi:hypothetical protein GBF38_008684 [Nibea albiflora]|uniref:Uncharacterized protein n=1 Tax=Nibea albiflora TaxID=240163 RepID=A0ACB7ERL7_NIBAL|nr:hypothetical protein GBF38_008684 [Nibea albiflora]